MLTQLGYVIDDGKVIYWNWSLIRVLADDGTTIQLDFASDHHLRFIGEARKGVLQSLRDMGLNVIDLKALANETNSAEDEDEMDVSEATQE